MQSFWQGLGAVLAFGFGVLLVFIAFHGVRVSVRRLSLCDPDNVMALDPGARFLSVLFFPFLVISGAFFMAAAVGYLFDLDGPTLGNHTLDFSGL